MGILAPHRVRAVPKITTVAEITKILRVSVVRMFVLGCSSGDYFQKCLLILH
jgi:hypothetical protein